MHYQIIKFAFAFFAFLLTLPISAKPNYHYSPKDPHFTAVIPANIIWQHEKSLPDGVFNTILEGQPKLKGPFTIREKIPPNFSLRPHWHNGAEHVTVISGVFYTGKGDTFDKKNGVRLPKGSYSVNPPKYHHFGWTEKEGAVLQINGEGPWTRTYVNQSDDPRG